MTVCLFELLLIKLFLYLYPRNFSISLECANLYFISYNFDEPFLPINGKAVSPNPMRAQRIKNNFSTGSFLNNILKFFKSKTEFNARKIDAYWFRSGTSTTEFFIGSYMTRNGGILSICVLCKIFQENIFTKVAIVCANGKCWALYAYSEYSTYFRHRLLGLVYVMWKRWILNLVVYVWSVVEDG